MSRKVASFSYPNAGRAFGRVNSCTHSQMCIFMLKEGSERRLYPPPSRQSRQLNKRLASAVFPSSSWNVKKKNLRKCRHGNGRWVDGPSFLYKRVGRRGKNKQQSGEDSAGKSVFPSQTEAARDGTFVCLSSFSTSRANLWEINWDGAAVMSETKQQKRKEKKNNKKQNKANIQKWKYYQFHTFHKKRKKSRMLFSLLLACLLS